MVTFIKSAADNRKRRILIRKTWASVRYTKSARLLYAFVIGRPDSNETFSLVKRESEIFGDILMYDGPNDYRLIFVYIRSLT